MQKMRIAILGLLLACSSCQRNEVAGKAPADHALSAQASGNAALRQITLPRYQADLPAGQGRDTFAVACLACHSPRYVAIQPPMTAAKWEENIRKMVKTYGALVDEAQVPIIAQYLVTTHQPGEADAWKTLAGVAADAPVPQFFVASDEVKNAAGHDEAFQRGRTLYASHCATCHGAEGRGDGASAATMLPRATDLTAHHYSAMALSTALWNGIPGTAMPAYRALPVDDLRALATFVRELSPARESSDLSGKMMQSARQLFADNCIACHGADGRGDGIAAPPLARRPADFASMQPARNAAIKAIGDGVAGTAMGQWHPKLKLEQQELLADYVRSLYSAPPGD
jgi:mono/diheme cytochrome c family protein